MVAFLNAQLGLLPSTEHASRAVPVARLASQLLTSAQAALFLCSYITALALISVLLELSTTEENAKLLVLMASTHWVKIALAAARLALHARDQQHSVLDVHQVNSF